MISCEKLVITNIDEKILRHFIGYFYERDQEQISKLMAFSAAPKKDQSVLDLRAENKAIPLVSSTIRHFELSSCQIDEEGLK